MKNSKKLKKWGFILLTIALILIVLGITVTRNNTWGPFGGFALLVPGSFLAVISLPIIFTGFNPQIAKFKSKLHSETMDYAGKDIKEAINKSADTVIPAITPSIKAAVSEINDDKKVLDKDSKSAQLIEAKNLLDNHLISEDEYKLMRKSILGIND